MFLKEKFKLSSSVNQYVLAYFVFVLLFYGIRYTADWATYTRMIEHPELSLDLLFRFLAERVRGECGVTRQISIQEKRQKGSSPFREGKSG